MTIFGLTLLNGYHQYFNYIAYCQRLAVWLTLKNIRNWTGLEFIQTITSKCLITQLRLIRTLSLWCIYMTCLLPPHNLTYLRKHHPKIHQLTPHVTSSKYLALRVTYHQSYFRRKVFNVCMHAFERGLNLIDLSSNSKWSIYIIFSSVFLYLLTKRACYIIIREG
jgi:hypothetical protein